MFIETLNELIAIEDINQCKEIKQYPLLSPDQHQQIIYEWNATERAYPADKTIHQLFEEQATKTPHNIAVIFEDKQLSYKELNESANQLAYYLQEKGVKPETLIAIACERSLEMIIGILGILKAGGAYVPIDPGYPQDRINFMLEDTHAQILLTQHHLVDQLPTEGREVIFLDDRAMLKDYKVSTLVSLSQPHHLAYVIYTSGSTGKPKGVMIEHHNSVALLCWAKEFYSTETLKSVLASTSICFDL